MAIALNLAEQAMDNSESSLENSLSSLRDEAWEKESGTESQLFRAESRASFYRTLNIERALLENYRKMREMILSKTQGPDIVDDGELAQSFLDIVHANEILIDRRLAETAAHRRLVGDYSQLSRSK